MPIYEYKCHDCGTKFEVLAYNEDNQVKCEKCGSANSEKLLSKFASQGISTNPPASCGGNSGFT